MRMKKDGVKILPKVGFHLWQNHFLRWTSRRLRGLEDSAKDLRGCKGGLPELAEKPNKAFFGQRWAFPCLTGFEASRRLNLSLYGAKVGFFLSDCLKRLLRWASRLRRWAFWPYLAYFGLFPGIIPFIYIIYVIDSFQN